MSASTVGALPYRFAARHRKMREFAGTQSVLKFFLGLLGSVREITDRDDNGFRALSALPGPGSQPGRERARPVGRPYPQLLPDAPP